MTYLTEEQYYKFKAIERLLNIFKKVKQMEKEKVLQKIEVILDSFTESESGTIDITIEKGKVNGIYMNKGESFIDTKD